MFKSQTPNTDPRPKYSFKEGYVVHTIHRTELFVSISFDASTQTPLAAIRMRIGPTRDEP